MAKKVCGECGSPRGTPHKDECSGSAYRERAEAKRCAACNKNVSRQAHDVVSCKRCGKRYYACCYGHVSAAQQLTNGHVFRVHPDTLPDADIDRVIDDAPVFTAFLEEAKKDPEMWVKLLKRFEERLVAREAMIGGLQAIGGESEAYDYAAVEERLPPEMVVSTELEGVPIPAGEFEANLAGLLHPKPETDK